MKFYRVSDELYVARILTGMSYIYSAIDDLTSIKEHLQLVKILKSINLKNVDEYKVKNTDLQARLYDKAKKHIHSKTISLGYLIDLAISAFNANTGIKSYDLANLLSQRLEYTKSGLYQYQIQKAIDEYFSEDEFIGRQELNDFCDYVLNDFQGKEKVR